MPRLPRNRRLLAVVTIPGAALVAVYLMLLLFLRVDGYLFPGNEASVPNVPVFVPGTQLGVDVTLPGVSTASSQPWNSSARLNILVLGLDRRPNEPVDGSFRSDTMFVVSIDKNEDRVQMLSIPRDLWTEVPYGDKPGVWAEAKVNAAYSYGQFFKYPGGGAAAAVAAIEHDLHIDIHHYVVIDWVGFVKLIDAIGGIDVDVPEPVSDYATDVLDSFPNQTVPAGPQHMDGVKALGYSRVRVDGDLKRIERQQTVIKAAIHDMDSLGLIARLPELWDAYHEAIRTDIDTGLVPGFALLARQLDLNRLETFSLGHNLYPGIAEDGELILLPNADEVYDTIDRFMADPKARDDAATIAIEYLPGQEAQAKAARAHLEAYGVPPAFITLKKGDGSAPGVFDLTGKKYTAGKMTALFDLRLLAFEGDAPTGTDILVRLGDATALKNP